MDNANCRVICATILGYNYVKIGRVNVDANVRLGKLTVQWYNTVI